MWKSTREIVEEFELQASPHDREGMITELKSRIGTLHPDKTGGGFNGDAQREAAYHRAVAALEYVRNQQTALVPISEVTALAERIAMAVAEARQEPVDRRVADAVDRNHDKTSRNYRTPKISLGAVTAALGYVALSPGSLMDHPFLGDYLSGPSGIYLWATATAALAHGWLLTWYTERREHRLVDWVFSLEGQKQAFRTVAREGREFTRNDLRDALVPARRSSPIPFLYPVLSHSTIEEAVDLALTRYAERGWIESVKKNSFEDSYRVQAEDLVPHGA